MADLTVSRLQTAETIQECLVEQLAKRLDIDPEDIDIQASFESYDLNSVEALALLNKMEEQLGCSISPTLLWNYPNIELLAQRLAEEDDPVEPTT